MRTKGKLNAIYNVAGDSTSGLLNPIDLDTAIAFLDRFNNPKSFERPVVTVEGTGRNKKETPVLHPDGTPCVETAVEIMPCQKNGYDSYANDFGFVRNDYPYELPPSALAKIALVALDALHRYAAGEDKERASAAKVSMQALREYDKVAAEKATERARLHSYEKALALALENGCDKKAFDKMWNAKNKVPNAPADIETAHS